MRPFLLLLTACGLPAEDPPPCTGPGTLSLDDGVAVEAEACGAVALTGRVLGEGDLSLSFEDEDGAVVPVIATTTGGVLRGVVLEGDLDLDGEGPLRWWRQGYQSWSWSGVVDPTAPPSRDADSLPPVGGDGDAITVVEETPWTSWWVGLVGRDGGPSLLAGALSATRTKVWLALDGEALQVVWGGRGESILLEPGASLRLDPVALRFGPDPVAVHEDYADAAAAHAGLAAPSRTPPAGWASWYVFYSDVTEDHVRDHLALMAETLPDLDLLQIDDGWQVRWGDWWAGDDFPSGMGPLADDIAAEGFTAGLWMAPLYVSRSSETYTAHPDWWVRGLDGTELRFTNVGSGDYAVLDVTHPAAEAWLRAVIEGKVAEGYRYLKLDFLYAGAQEGLRHEPVTGTEAYARAAGILRTAAGDAWILACGAPLLPSLGMADSFRTGADIAFEVDPDPRRDYLRWQARQTGARAWTHGRWWWMDPDQLIYREPFGPVEATGAVVAQVVSGGTWLLGDDLTVLDPALVDFGASPDLLRFRGARAVPLDPLAEPSGIDGGPLFERVQADDHPPARWALSTGHTALLNLGDAPLAVEGPGGTEWFSGTTAGPGEVILAPGEGQLWLPQGVDPRWPELAPW